MTVLVAALSAAVLVTGCATPSEERPRSRPLDGQAAGVPAGTAPAGISPDWWRQFDDPGLDALVERAFAGSPTLKMAQARVRRALAQSEAVEADDRPELSGSGSVVRRRYTEKGLVPPPIAGSVRNESLLQLSGNWNLDLFGRNRAELEAAVGARRAAEADAALARLVLAAGVTQSYFELAGLLQQDELLERAVRQREAILALVDRRVRAGLDSQVERRQAEGAVPEARKQHREVQNQILHVRDALAALTGQGPESTRTLRPRLNVTRMELPAAIPADLLARRPDVAAAQWRASAAEHERAAARAQFYPSVNLMAFAGLSSITLGQLTAAGSRQFGIGPAIHLPMFDAGRLQANYAGKTAQLDAAVEDYNRTVLEAVRDAADQIGSVQSLQLQEQDQRDATRSAAEAYALGLKRYRAGVGNYLTVLIAEGNLLKQQLAQAGVETRLQQSRVALMRALGGGYAPAQSVDR